MVEESIKAAWQDWSDPWAGEIDPDLTKRIRIVVKDFATKFQSKSNSWVQSRTRCPKSNIDTNPETDTDTCSIEGSNCGVVGAWMSDAQEDQREKESRPDLN